MPWLNYFHPTVGLSGSDRRAFWEDQEKAERLPLLWGMFLCAVCFGIVGLRQRLSDIPHAIQVFSTTCRLTTCVFLFLVSLGFLWAPKSVYRYVCMHGYMIAMATCSALLMMIDPLHASDITPLFLVMFMAFPALVRHPSHMFGLTAITATASVIGLWIIGFPAGLTLATLMNEGVTIALALYVCLMRNHDQIELFTVQMKLREQAERDPLTKALNRGRWDSEGQIRERSPNRAGAMLFVDIDNFKTINDSFGHDSGDYVLVNLIRILTRQLDETPGVSDNYVLARLGGEEFGILLDETNLEKVLNLAQSLRQSVESFNFSLTLPVTISVGAALRLPGESCGDWQRRADEAMYQAKKAGRNRVVLASTVRALPSIQGQPNKFHQRNKPSAS